MDKLDELFAQQEQLNDLVFRKQNLRKLDGTPLTTRDLVEMGRSDDPKGPNTDTNRWLGNYLKALQDECRELGDELLWKWWSKDTLDMQNIRVEIIDQLHFWMSLALCAGMDAQKVFDVYVQKNKVNVRRQDLEALLGVEPGQHRRQGRFPHASFSGYRDFHPVSPFRQMPSAALFASMPLMMALTRSSGFM